MKKKIKELIEKRPELKEKLHPNLPYLAAEVIWAVQNEMARTLEDVLSRRTRSLFLDVKASLEIAEKVAKLIARELKKDEHWIQDQLKQFQTIAKNYTLRQSKI